MELLRIVLNEDQKQKLEDFIAEQEKVAIDRERRGVARTYSTPSLAPGTPYSASIGGDVTYEITPTGVGPIIKVRYLQTGSVLNLTDFNSW